MIVSTGLPGLGQISRIPDTFFPNRESCLQTRLMEPETSRWVMEGTKTVRDLKKGLLGPESPEAKNLLQKVKDEARRLAEKQIPDYSRRLVINRASLVAYPERKYLMLYQPSETNKIEWFWKSILGFNCRQVVAAIKPNEEQGDHTLEYCQAMKYPLKIDEEWTIKLKEEKVLATSHKVEGCEIVQRTFLAVSSQTQEQCELKHYHYQGWKNKKGAPDSELLARLILELNGEFPVAVHCACGRGRSANVVLADIFRRRLQSQLHRASLEDAKLNIAEALFQGRLQRDGFLETAEQISSAFEGALRSLARDPLPK